MRRMVCRVMWMVLLLPALATAEAKITIIKKEPTVKTRLFNPKNRPSDMPPLNEGEAALCAYNLAAQASVAVSIVESGDRSSCRVELTELKMQLTCDIVLWLPQGYTRKIKDHEEGHRRITERIYANSDRLARALAQAAAARPIEGRPGRCQETAERAMNDVAASLTRQWIDRTAGHAGRVNDLFDKLTDHGRNDLPEDKAIEQAFERARKEPLAEPNAPAEKTHPAKKDEPTQKNPAKADGPAEQQ